MAETIGLSYFAEVPIVIWDVQRVGPSTGLPTHTSQGDLAFAASISHGDKDIVILLPTTVGECFEFGWQALDFAEQLQTPVIILSDLELGMNIWMTDNLKYPDRKIRRGKVLWEKDLQKLMKKGADQWGRYKDLDGDGVPYRTVPGNLDQHAAYFTRGTGHDEYAHYSEDNRTWESNLLRLKKKFETAKGLLPRPEIIEHKGKIGVVTYGSSLMPVIEAVDNFADDKNPVDLLCIKALPFADEVEAFLESHRQVIVVEANRDGQMKNLLCMHYPQYASKMRSTARCDGLALSVEWIISRIKALTSTGGTTDGDR
jgi:2-oxoglutarate ferredoxin oxidoreductase subunit alpha